MMLEAVLVLAMSWPKECLALGEVYQRAAHIRDSGARLEVVVQLATAAIQKRALLHVYAKRDMTPQQWKWFMIGACSTEDEAYKRVNAGRV